MEKYIKERCPYNIDIKVIYNVYVRNTQASWHAFYYSYQIGMPFWHIIAWLQLLILSQPTKRHAYAQVGDKFFMPMERELVLDIVSVISYWI